MSAEDDLEAHDEELRRSAAAQRLVAFEGIVELSKWADTSGSGQRIWLKLADREALAHFDKVTKRRGGKGGQIYRYYFADPDGVLIDEMQGEAWFIGATWSHTEGAKITLEVPDLTEFRKRPTTDGSAVDEGAHLHLTLVQINEESEAIDQVQQDKNTALEQRLKGGAESKRAAILTQAEDFRQFVAERMYGAERPPERRLVTSKEADAWMKRHVRIQSKIELDHDQDALGRYKKLMGWFLGWGRRRPSSFREER